MIVSDIRAEVFTSVYALLEREMEKLKLHGDTETADYVEMLVAKIRALERTIL